MQSSVTLYFLPVALLALLHSAAPSAPEARHLQTRRSAEQAPHSPLALLLRKRSLEAALRAPPSSVYYPDSMFGAERKREDNDQMWIWMPAHGYIPVPRNSHQPDSAAQEYRVGNLIRHG